MISEKLNKLNKTKTVHGSLFMNEIVLVVDFMDNQEKYLIQLRDI